MTVPMTLLLERNSGALSKMASKSSPSFMVPYLLTAMTRSPSPSKANPISAWRSITSFCNISGCRVPQLWLMLVPVGAVACVMTCAPKCLNKCGAMCAVAPCAQSRTIFLPAKYTGLKNEMIARSYTALASVQWVRFVSMSVCVLGV